MHLQLHKLMVVLINSVLECIKILANSWSLAVLSGTVNYVV